MNRQSPPQEEHSKGKKLLRDMQTTLKGEEELLLVNSKRLGNYGPSVQKHLLESMDILQLKGLDSDYYHEFLLENASSIVGRCQHIYEEEIQGGQNLSSNFFPLYLEALLATGQPELVYSFYDSKLARRTSTSLEPFIYTYSMAAAYIMEDKEKCLLILSNVRQSADVRTKDELGYCVLEILRNLKRVDLALQWLQFCKEQDIALNIPCKFLELYVDKDDKSTLEKIFQYCAECKHAKLIFEMNPKDRRVLETNLKIALYLLQYEELSSQWIQRDYLYNVIVDNITEPNVLFGLLDGFVILGRPIESEWVNKLLFLCMDSQKDLKLLSPSLIVSFLQRASNMYTEHVVKRLLEWALQRKDFQGAHDVIEWLEKQSYRLNSDIVLKYIQIAAQDADPRIVPHMEVRELENISSIEKPSQVISCVGSIITLLNNKGVPLKEEFFLELETILRTLGLTESAQTIAQLRQSLPTK
eukprot:jgi/Galph1/354/GphlegSOOS_G5091.1